MKKALLSKPGLSHYTNMNQLEFHIRSSELCQKHAVMIDSPPLIEKYVAATAKEISVLNYARRSDFTEKKQEADHQRDKLYIGVTWVIRANLKHYDPKNRDAALHISNMLETYGDVKRKNYDAETAAIDGIVKNLRSELYAPAAALLDLQTWVNKLQDANERFKEYVANTSREKIIRPNITPKEARRNTDNCMYKITDRIEAMVNLNGREEYEPFIEAYNNLVKHFNTVARKHYGLTHVRTDISKVVIARIAPQQFTCQPIFVIPFVTLNEVKPDGSKTVVKLTFSTDFTARYTNNIEPGMATITIHGIGKYKGQSLTTFFIE